MARQTVLNDQIELLRTQIPDLRGILLASNEGYPIAHSLPDGGDPNRIAAMAAAATTLGVRASDSASTGQMAELTIMTDNGNLFFYPAGTQAILAIIGPKDANAGLIHIEAHGIANDIRALVDG